MTRIEKCKIILLILIIILCILNIWIESYNPKLGEPKPINKSTKVDLVDVIIEAKYTEGMQTMVNVRYGDTINNCTFTGIDGLIMRLKRPGDTISMYLNTQYNEFNIPVARWLNIGN